ncbi:MAG TPA: hypothetical protein V6C50_06465 [Crinalium sp.]
MELDGKGGDRQRNQGLIPMQEVLATNSPAYCLSTLLPFPVLSPWAAVYTEVFCFGIHMIDPP